MSEAVKVWTGHTSDLDPGVLAATHAMLVQAFDGDFDEHDWDHALGGVHVIVWAGDEVVGHGSVVQRRMLLAGNTLRCGYVEAVAVHPDHRKQGHGSTIMHVLEQLIRGAYALGALAASDDGIELYRAHGWQVWNGQSFGITPNGVERTERSDGAIMVFPLATPLDVAGDITCDWRDGDLW